MASPNFLTAVLRLMPPGLPALHLTEFCAKPSIIEPNFSMKVDHA
jgi:hypothetical protein